MTTSTTTEKVEIDKSKNTTSENIPTAEALKHYATHGDLQKEHKETRTFGIGLIALIIAAMGFIGNTVNSSVKTEVSSLDKTMATKFDGVQKDIGRLEGNIKELTNDSKAMRSDIAEIKAMLAKK